MDGFLYPHDDRRVVLKNGAKLRQFDPAGFIWLRNHDVVVCAPNPVPAYVLVEVSHVPKRPRRVGLVAKRKVRKLARRVIVVENVGRETAAKRRVELTVVKTDVHPSDARPGIHRENLL